MNSLKKIDTTFISGGEIIPGKLTNDMIYINVKLMIEQGRNQPGFDVGMAALALTRVAPHDFYNLNIALEYVRTGHFQIPIMYRLNQFLNFQFIYTFFIF